jgi:ubiquinone/menaquinone biosynthesis C-methylase UbiE
MTRADFSKVATVYDAGRGLPVEAMDVWRGVVQRHLPGQTNLPGLDLGCGTGRFTVALAEWLSCHMIGIDTSGAMLAQAQPRAAVSYLLARAEEIPIVGGACDFAWLSTVVHHFDDLLLVASELRRVLRPGGTVLVRSWFPGRPDVTHFQYFPRAKQIAETFPAVAEVEGAFAKAGFRLQAIESVSQMSAPSLRAFCDQVRTRADSTLLGLTDEEFANGLRKLKREADEELHPQPVYSSLDLLELR